jgi:hypothetical protein
MVAFMAIGCGRIGFDPPNDLAVLPPGFGPAATSCTYSSPGGPVVHVAPDGDDTSGDGSLGAPWRSIQMTYDRVAPGTTILLQPGVYGENVVLDRTISPQRITIRAAIPYTARLEAPEHVLYCQGCTGLVLEGLDVRGLDAGSVIPVLHIDFANDVTVRNCIVNNAGSNATLRVAGDPVGNITIARNMLYDGGPALHVADASAVTVEDNFILDARSVPDREVWIEAPTGAPTVIRRNIIAGFRGCDTCGMLQLRLDQGSRVESNLFIGGPAPSQGALQLEGSTGLTFQFNTVVGDLPGSAFALTGTTYGGTATAGLTLANNIFSDPTGTMGDFADRTTAEIIGPMLRGNLYWNAGTPVPGDPNDAVTVQLDPQPILADPRLPAATFVPTTWDPAAGKFSDGSSTICEAFYGAAMQYGAISGDSPAAGAATGSDRPADLLGFTRPTASVGALEPR